MNQHFIKKIKINQLRHLEDITIDLDEKEKRHLLLTGKNGAGKTTLLECIKKYLKAIEDNNIKDRAKTWKETIDNYNGLLNNTSASISDRETYKKIVDGSLYSIRRYGEGIDIDFSIYEDLDRLYKEGKFVLAYYEANRKTIVQIPMGVEKIELKEFYTLEEKPSDIFIKYLVDLKTQQSFARNENDLEVVENIEAWFNRFEKALRTILDDESIKLKFNYKNYNFAIIQNNREPYGLNELSDGYSSIINIISDLILRMDKNRASEERNYAFDTEGIVLIDELETHLHIELQKKILPFLTEFFPNIQFIVTTHSPFVLNSIDNAVIYDLEKKIRIENLSNYSYEGIVEGYFEVDNYSKELKEKLEEYKNLAFRKDLNDDEKARRAELRIEFKNASNDLAKELKDEFNEIEEKRKQ